MSEEYTTLEQLKREVYNLRACSSTAANMLRRDGTPSRDEVAQELGESTGRMFELVLKLVEQEKGPQ